VKYLLDTHTWTWWNARPEALSPKVRQLLSAPEQYDELLLSAISLWEFALLLDQKKLGLSLAPEQWIETALDMPGLRLVPLSPRIACGSIALPEPAPSDPVDRALAATARDENAVLLTCDSALHQYPHIRTLW
jgi:PIN domain nuclease of toxin-antitoxin system